MHELSVTRDILRIVLEHAEANGVIKIEKINIELGELSGFEAEWIQHYFDKISRGTAAEEAKIEVELRPLKFSCGVCGTLFPGNLSSKERLLCPRCDSGDVHMVSGDEYRIKSMEAW